MSDPMGLWDYTPPAGERDTAERSNPASPATTPQAEKTYQHTTGAFDGVEVVKTFEAPAIERMEIDASGHPDFRDEAANPVVLESMPIDDDEPIEVAPGQANLFGEDDQFTVAGQEWQAMPEYVSGNLTPWKSMLVHFESYEDLRRFATLIEQPNITVKTKSVWYPEQEMFHFIDKRYVAEGEAS